MEPCPTRRGFFVKKVKPSEAHRFSMEHTMLNVTELKDALGKLQKKAPGEEESRQILMQLTRHLIEITDAFNRRFEAVKVPDSSGVLKPRG
jgi:hypothetical protein